MPRSRASSASRWLFELFWLPRTSATSASSASKRHRLLAILRGVADVVLRRGRDVRKPLLQPVDDPVGIVHAERRLRQIRHLALVGDFQRRHVLRRLDQHDRLGRFAHRADHLVVALVADQQNRVALRGRT